MKNVGEGLNKMAKSSKERYDKRGTKHNLKKDQMVGKIHVIYPNYS